ncbi:MAG: ATP-binding protein [Candidatus Brockarchaeota archaeon]|nr:ATP-binding protein [Candidatus Brockarchaeota archaeon]
MLFDLKPKERKRDLFGREQELQSFLDAIQKQVSLILLLGVRRIGKTSLLKVGLEECNAPHIYFDLRILEAEGVSKPSLYRLFSSSFNVFLSRRAKISDLLKKVKGVSFAGHGIEFDWSREGLKLTELFQTVDQWAGKEESRVIMAFDEAQILRLYKGGGKSDFRSLFAYCYDNLHSITIVLTGSEVGLLFEFLGLDESKSPLYGRYAETITLKPFDNQTSRKFLIEGFKEYGVKPPEEFVDKAVEKLDGIVGWLTYLGNKSIKEGFSSATIDAVMEEASRIVETEIRKLEVLSKYYLLTLRAIANGSASWTEIKRTVEAWAGIPLTNAQITRTLEKLIEMGFIEKKENLYAIIDPLVKFTVKRRRYRRGFPEKWVQ